MPESELTQENNKMYNKYQRIYVLEDEKSAEHMGSLEVGTDIVHFSMFGGEQ